MENQKCECITSLARKRCSKSIGNDCENELYSQAQSLKQGVHYREFPGTGDLVKLVVTNFLCAKDPKIIGLMIKGMHLHTTITIGSSKSFIALCFSSYTKEISYDEFEQKAGRHIDAVQFMLNTNKIKL